MRRLALLLGLALLGGCDDSSGGDDGPDGPRDGRDAEAPLGDALPDDDATAEGCEDDARRCMGADVQVCLGGEWRLLSTCGDGTSCQDGLCVDDGCTPSCDRKVCGDDGCGGVCGECGEAETCDDGRCVAEGPACNDGVCQASEDCNSCAADCGCAEDETCGEDGRCVVMCQPDCGERACGDDGCGSACGECGEQVCTAEGACVDAPAMCGDGACGGDEDCATCPADCGQCCGDGACNGPAGENCATCLADCACAEDQLCDPDARACVAGCVPQCDDRACGGDGCGGSCGDCEGEDVCTDDGRCVDVCEPSCDDAICGGDGCGGSCGVCPGGSRCDEGDCVELCVPDCAGRDCGEDGCGGVCGGCGGGQFCDEAGQCVDECVPSCDGLQCGDDGCGGACGECGDDENCEAGQCVPLCVPSCDGLACGADGCGGSCGDCGDGFACEGGRCVDQRGCDCDPGQRCLDGICRDPELLCSEDNPNGVCLSGEDCLAGSCVDAGDGCTPQNPVGLCVPGEVCRGGECEPLDDAALCDDLNQCTRDVYDPVRNRCVRIDDDGPCSDGNACTEDRCEAGECVSDLIPGCIEPPGIGPYVTPTNVNAVDLIGTKPAGSSIEINGLEAVPPSPDEEWAVQLNLDPGENVFEIRSVDNGQASEVVTVRIVFDITPPVTTVTPAGGVFLSAVTVTVAADEAATVYYTDDGGTPDQWSKRFDGVRTFRIFDSTTLRFRARDPAGNWEEEIVTAEFEITGYFNGWRSRAETPEPLALGAVTSQGDSIFLVGGTDGDAAQAGAARYDIGNEAWTNLPALAVARTQAAAVTDGNQLYVLGGENDGIPLNFVQRLSVGNPQAWEDRRPMPTTRFGLGVALVNNRIYAFGGKTNGEVVLDTLEVYDINGNGWNNAVEQMPRPRFAFATVVRENLVYLVGGEDEEGQPIAEVDVYDPANDRWSQVPDLPTPRSFPAAGRMDNLGNVGGHHKGVLVAGGRLANGRATPVVEEYVVELGEWRERTPLPFGVFGGGGATVVVDGVVDRATREVWVVGGQRDGGLSSSLVAYRHDLDYARRIHEMPEGRFFHAAVPLDDQIYLFGGRDFRETVGGWKFDPETSVYSDLPELPSPQNALAAVALDGRLYAIGGRNEFGLAVPHVRTLDPPTDRWVDRQPLQVARSEAAVTVVGDEIWVIGGDNNGPSQAVEIYDPATDRWRNGPVLPEGRKGAVAVSVDDEILLFGGLTDGDAQRIVVLRMSGGAWANTAGRVPVAYATGTAVGDTRAALFAGRSGGDIVNDLYRYDHVAHELDRDWLPGTDLLASLDRSAGAWLHGRMYLFGGNENAEPGPGGVTTVQQVDGRCMNGVLDPGEGQDANIPDVGGMCGEVTGCAVLVDPAAAAMARCRADGFTCVERQNAVVGYGNGGGIGSDCSPGHQWRMYCWGNGASNATCNAQCRIGELRQGHIPCGCNNQPGLFGRWCE